MKTRFLKFLLLFFCLYLFIGFYAIPSFLKPQIISTVEENLNAHIKIDEVLYNPFISKVTLENISIINENNNEVFFVESASLNIALYSLLKSTLRINNLMFIQPRISLIIDKNKKMNLSSLLKNTNTNPSQEEISLPRIIVEQVKIQDASFKFEDQSNEQPFHFEVDSLDFELKNIDTQTMNKNNGSIRLLANLEDGSLLNIKSKITSLEPFIIEGNIDYQDAKLYSQWRYFQDMLNFEIADGTLHLNSNYIFNANDINNTQLSSLNVSLNNLRIKPKGNNKDLIQVKNIYISKGVIKPFLKDVFIESVGLESLKTFVKREKNIIDILELIKTSPNKEEVSSTKEKQWNVRVGTVELKKMQLKFEDKDISPHRNTQINELNIFAKNINLLGDKPLNYTINMQLNKHSKCSSVGTLLLKEIHLESTLKCESINIAYYAPYIDSLMKENFEVYDLRLTTLQSDFHTNVSLKIKDNKISFDIKDTNVNLKNFELIQKSTQQKVGSFKSLKIKGVQLDSINKRIVVNKASLNRLKAKVLRGKDGKINISNLLVPKIKKEIKKVNKKEQNYTLVLNKFALSNASVSLNDKTVKPNVSTSIDKIYFDVFNIDTNEKTWMKYYLSANLNKTGILKANGSLRHTPLKQKGTLHLDKLPIKEITPYLEDKTYIRLEDGYVSFDVKTRYAPSIKKTDFILRGSMKLEEIFMNDTRDDSTLFSLSDLELKEITFESYPNRVFVNKVDLNAFYINAFVDSNKTFNLAKLIKETNTTVSSEEGINEEPFDVKIMQVNVRDGSAIFIDESLPLNFQTDIHDLNGAVYAISNTNEEVSYIDINGEIDRYGATKLKGSVYASDPKEYTDIGFSFSNLDLSAMSGYSSTFAGYIIEDGKLFVNLNYQIQDSNLFGENSIMIKKIKLGKQTQEGASIPLDFLIGLLEDREGLIDIDLPIRGNIDSPDFHYSSIVWNAIGNLIVTAVSSPFSFFLGSEEGDELKYIGFEAGKFSISAMQREKLDKIADFLLNRKSGILTGHPRYNTSLDLYILQKEKLFQLVIKKSDAKNERDIINAMNIDLLEEVYEEISKEDKLDSIQATLKEEYSEKQFQREYLKVLVEECTKLQLVSKEELATLAEKRFLNMKQYLEESWSIHPSRIEQGEIKGIDTDTKFVRSEFEIIME